MVSVERKEGFTLKISRILRESTTHRLDLYLFVPGELGLSSDVIAENAFYHGAIHVKRTYYSDRHQLPLVLSRLARRGSLDSDQYRLSLSLYAYQYVVALERGGRELHDAKREEERNEKEAAAQAEARQANIEELIELALDILKRLRRSRPEDARLHKYFANIDNYLSWFTEQRLLSLVAHLPRDRHYKANKARLLAICQAEQEYRQAQEYNSARVNRDPTRISNKMRLLRRLIEYPVTLKEKTQELGGGEEKAVKALATAVVMIFVSLGLLQARESIGDITALFVLVLAVLYALREVFKDDLRTTLWRWLRKGRPKWRRQYYDVHSNQLVGRQLEWFDYQRYSKLDEAIKTARKRNVAQREEMVLHYRSSSRMSPTRFLSGYEQTRETLTLDLAVLSRLMDKASHHVYRVKDGQVVRESVEKRHLINLVTRERSGDGEPVIQRWKVVMSRSKIVDIEPAEPGQSAASATTDRDPAANAGASG
ncbi:hypothetical protein SAMN05192555_10214 [Franzmannia pantelleriensis]|uniref:Uncharacterized protein n=1 Tax=Franzmannia pantelleriensis TaxID=48727 RepID=A0A1G9G3U9_9GAMM|nr:hypothetical protein [Halomonas pantelleriensis]SDK95364.1 hypothetical protein SAMN05192555_10214 [Halomonas pantelleriensis]